MLVYAILIIIGISIIMFNVRVKKENDRIINNIIENRRKIEAACKKYNILIEQKGGDE